MLSGTLTQSREADDDTDDTDDDIEKQFHSALTPRDTQPDKRQVGSARLADAEFYLIKSPSLLFRWRYFLVNLVSNTVEFIE